MLIISNPSNPRLAASLTLILLADPSMASGAGTKKYSVEATVRQSLSLDFSNILDDSWLKDKTIVITGGASGFGAGFLQRWAVAGAAVIIGDINVRKGDQLVRDLRKETGNGNLHFVHCDVTDWQSQVNFFREAVKLSPHGGIDTVVANAGTAASKAAFELPDGLDAVNPPAPDLSILDVNLTGVVYTSHLALYYLKRNPNSSPANPNCDLANTHRDRHLLLISSVAGFLPLPGAALYGASKHAVLGLYRCLRSTSFVHGVRVNVVCPYFMDTPILSAGVRAILAGGLLGKVEDVVEAATRFTADPRVVGRAVSVGPKVKVEQDQDGEWTFAEDDRKSAVEKAIWEVYAHDFENADLFQRRMIGIFNRGIEKRGWVGWASDMVGAMTYALKSRWSS